MRLTVAVITQKCLCSIHCPAFFIFALFYTCNPTPAHLQNLVGHGAVAEQRHHALDTLVGSFLIVVLGALDGVKEAVPVVGDALQHVVDPAGRDVASLSVVVTIKRCVDKPSGERLRALGGSLAPVRLPGVLNKQDL